MQLNFTWVFLVLIVFLLGSATPSFGRYRSWINNDTLFVCPDEVELKAAPGSPKRLYKLEANTAVKLVKRSGLWFKVKTTKKEKLEGWAPFWAFSPCKRESVFGGIYGLNRELKELSPEADERVKLIEDYKCRRHCSSFLKSDEIGELRKQKMDGDGK